MLRANRQLATHLFIITIVVCSLPVLAACWWVAPLHLTGESLLRCVLISAFLTVVGACPLRLSTHNVYFLIMLPVSMALAYLYGPFCTVIACAGSALFTSAFSFKFNPRLLAHWRHYFWVTLFNSGNLAFCLGLTTFFYALALRLHLFYKTSLAAGCALALISVAEFYLSAVLVTAITVIAVPVRWDMVWYENYRWTLVNTLLLSPVGYIMGALTEQNLSYGLAFILLPLFAIHKGYGFHDRQIRTYRQGIDVLGRMMQESHPYTHGHLNRVANWAVKIGAALNLPPESMAHVENAAILHDIGKIALDDRILNKIEKLTDDEWGKIKEHPVVGAEIASSMRYLDQVSLWIRHHHERIDGKGYPDGLAGEAIPIESRIICIVDAFDAMVGGASKADHRPYRLPKTMDEARAELVRCAGTQFDERVVNCFLDILDSEREPERLPSVPLLTLVTQSAGRAGGDPAVADHPMPAGARANA